MGMKKERKSRWLTSPEESVAPIIFSGSRPLSKPLGLPSSSTDFLAFFFGSSFSTATDFLFLVSFI
jgi:hypothetical protein